MIQFAKALKGTLPACEELHLSHNKIECAGIEALAKETKLGALPSCKKLDLRNNKIGDRGLKGLTAALDTGALPQCMEIDISGNKTSKSVKTALTRRWLEGDFLLKHFSAVISLDCEDLGWGNRDMEKFVKALNAGALPACEKIDLTDNEIGGKELERLAAALDAGALPQCKEIDLSGNNANQPPRDVIKKAAPRAPFT